MRKWIIGLCLCYVLYLVLSMTVLPAFHKSGGQQPIVQDAFSGAGMERVLCVDESEEALAWRLRVMEEAQQEIICSTFDLGADESGKIMMAAFLHAAERGVNVKILVDGFSAFLHLRGSSHFQALAASPNVEIKVYNPVTFLKPWKNNYRMHDKYLIADEAMYLLGGRNMTDLFLGNYRKTNIDRDFLVYEEQAQEGSSLFQVKDYFTNVWQLSESKSCTYKAGGKKYETALQELRTLYDTHRTENPDSFARVDYRKETIPVNRISLISNPIQAKNKEPVLWNTLCGLMREGKELRVQTPYIVCNKKMYRDMTELCGTGREMQILLNAVESGANPWGCTDYLNQKDNILDTGTEIFECIAGRSLHTKMVLIDDQISVVGSFNFDMRSAYLDTEMMLVIDSPELNRYLSESFDSYKSVSKHCFPDGREIDGEAYKTKKLPAKKRLFYGVLRAVIPPFRHLL